MIEARSSLRACITLVLFYLLADTFRYRSLDLLLPLGVLLSHVDFFFKVGYALLDFLELLLEGILCLLLL